MEDFRKNRRPRRAAFMKNDLYFLVIQMERKL